MFAVGRHTTKCDSITCHTKPACLFPPVQAPKPAAAPTTNSSQPQPASGDVTGSHHELLLKLLADELGCKTNDIGGWGLCRNAVVKMH